MNSTPKNSGHMARIQEEKTCLPVEIDTEDEDDHHGNKCYNVCMDLISLILAAVEIALVIYLSVHHFQDAMGIIALAMLAPIVLNFVGVTYFFSNKEERLEFERVGITRCAKDLFQVPVLGPVFTACKVLMISSGCSTAGQTNYARFEASAIKMRQAESFFGAAPEALVQLTVLLVTRGEQLKLDNYLEIAVVVVSVLTLAEANMYGVISNYYKLFHEYEIGDWKLPPLSIPKKLLLFCHSLTAIGSRIAASSFLKSAIKYIFIGNMMSQQQRAIAMRQAMSAVTTTVLPALTRPPRVALYTSSWQNHYYDDHITKTTTTMRTTTTTLAPNSTTATAMANSDDANQLAFLVVGTMMVEIGVRIVLFYIARLIKYAYIGDGIPSGCYESINYGWRATILDFGYQSRYIFVQVWFYVENLSFFFFWWWAVSNRADGWVEASPFSPISAIFLLSTILSIFFLFGCRGLELHYLKTPFNRKSRPG